ncbi:tail fiber assembly protein [Pseudomonas sp. NPDC089401]|uniref:tail fiber assembly protein n=1 Tax=Pseudomonas sp. NPDC089401 TaxID=3364462 RepID=UPI0038082998
MKYFKNEEDGQIYAFEDDGSQDFLITDSMRPLTPEETEQLLNPPVDYAGLALLEATHLRAAADSAIAPLQDAVDLGRADQAKKDLLLAWRNYRVDLSEVPDQVGYPAEIEWPTPPA